MEMNSRRKFLSTCLAGIGVTAAVLFGYPLFRYLAPSQRGSATGKVTFSSAALQEGEAKFFEFAGSSAVLIKKSDGSVVALSAVCTHLGCIVQWRKDHQQFLCPCHGGLYSADGTVLAGPPPTPLKKIPVELREGVIIVG